MNIDPSVIDHAVLVELGKRLQRHWLNANRSIAEIAKADAPLLIEQ